jgi:hypothetical protein
VTYIAHCERLWAKSLHVYDEKSTVAEEKLLELFDPRDGFRITVASAVLKQWYSTFLVRVPPLLISVHLCTPKVLGV